MSQMHRQEFEQLLSRADNGALDALRQLVEVALAPNPWGLGRPQAYKYCLMAAFLGDRDSHLQAADLFGELPKPLEESMFDEVADWIEEKLDGLPDESVEHWSPELLRIRFPASEVH